MKTMGKMGFHFRKHGHYGHKSARCNQTDKWSGWRACAGQGHGGKQQPNENMSHGPCHQHGHGHHHHHHGFGKWGSKGMMRKFHHAHVHHFHNYHQKHGHTHPHCHQHGHEGCSHHGMGKERMEKRQELAHQCCASRSQSKACQTEPIVEEAADCSDSQAIETEVDQAST